MVFGRLKSFGRTLSRDLELHFAEGKGASQTMCLRYGQLDNSHHVKMWREGPDEIGFHAKHPDGRERHHVVPSSYDAAKAVLRDYAREFADARTQLD